MVGKINSLSFVINKIYSEYLGMINREAGSLDNMYLTQLDALIEQISTWNNYEYYTDKLRNFRSILIQRGQKVFDADPNQFNAIIHGDLWTNNIMLTYSDSGKPCRQQNQQLQQQQGNLQLDNVTFIDFQFSCWTSPTIDLHYLFNTSLCEDLRLYHQEELIQYYHKKLTTVLKRLNYQKHVPSLHEFQVQFLQKSFYGTYKNIKKKTKINVSGFQMTITMNFASVILATVCRIHCVNVF